MEVVEVSEVPRNTDGDDDDLDGPLVAGEPDRAEASASSKPPPRHFGRASPREAREERDP